MKNWRIVLWQRDPAHRRARTLSILALLLASGTGIASETNDPVAVGARIYGEVCSNCHGPEGSGLALFKGSVEDLRSILSGQTNRMPDFFDVFSSEEVEAIYAYLRAQNG